MKGFTTCLWFDTQAEEAAHFYTSIFKHSRVGTVSHYGDSGARASGRPKGSVMTVAFELGDQKFLALNGGPIFKFSEAVSLMVNCEDQQEIDEYWAQLSTGGSEGPCGWLKDKFGFSWQVVPTALAKMMKDGDAEQLERVMAAVLTMKKLDLETLERAYEGEPSAVGSAAT